jgi:hypothetical protein
MEGLERWGLGQRVRPWHEMGRELAAPRSVQHALQRIEANALYYALNYLIIAAVVLSALMCVVAAAVDDVPRYNV